VAETTDFANRLNRSVAGHGVLVTGAGSGIGLATARLFAAEGAAVAVADLNAEAAEKATAGIRQTGGMAFAFGMDVADPASVRQAVVEAVQKLGRLDVVVNNAGLSAVTAIDGPDYDFLWQRHLAVVLTGQQLVIRAALPALRQARAARIINIASTEGLGATARLSPYAAAKAGVIGLTRSLAVELGPEGITVNCVCPGPVLTGMTEAIPAEQREIYASRRTALRRYGAPEELADMILNIALPSSSFLTGAVIPVDGGLMARNA
jgi:3-oxoacyl-[acyl-carrier protein] reductase